ncbi:MAG: hypothetical protein J7L25_01840 [Deltaproteobacteria bacterium]|nr:hypothetical protein [Candidatus Tharpella aukensis]
MKNLISTLLIVIYLLIWVLPSGANSGLVKVASTKPSVAMELFGHPVSGTTAITSVLASPEICFSHFADSSSWWTGIAIANPGQIMAAVTMVAYNDSGEQIGQDFNLIIPPQSQMEPATINTIFTLGEAETGWIKLTSTQPVVALEIFGHTDSGGIAGFSPVAAATEICIPHFAEDKDWWTGIAVANPGTVTTHVSIAAFSDAGNQIGDTYTVSIAAGCRMTPQIVRNLISLGEHTSGWLKITATQPVAAMEIFGQSSTSMLAGLSAGKTGTKLYYPYFQEGSGKWTGIAIANPGAIEAQVTLKALNNDGDTVGAINNRIVPASGRMTPQTITGLFGSLDNETGYLEVTANHPVAGLGVMGGDGWLAGYTAVEEQTGALAFPHFADSNGWWTKLALVNTSDDTATLSMAAYGVTGTLVGEEKNVELGPFAAVVENLPFSNSDVDPVAEVTKTIGILGGTLTATNSLGDVLSLEIPIGALQEETEITLRALNVPLTDPIAKNVFPGVEIVPDGTTFLVPAKLKVVLAEPLDNSEIAVLYHVKTTKFVVPIDDLVATETSIEGYISHLSDYGGGEPSSAEAQAQLEIALGEIPMSGSSNFSESQEAVSYALAICKEMLFKGGDESCMEEIAMLVLHEVQDFLKRPRPEPPCDPDYVREAYAYAKMIRKIGLPSFDDPVLTAAAQAVFQQLTDLIEELIQRCEKQINLIITEVITTEVMTINYSGEINLGWDAYGYSGDSTHVYGTGILPITGSGGFGEVDYTVDGLWTIVANGSLDVICTEHGSLKDLELNLELNGHVVQWMVACTDKDCIENESDYEKDKTLKIRMGGGATQTQIIPEFFDGGVSITIVTVDMVGDPMAQ